MLIPVSALLITCLILVGIAYSSRPKTEVKTSSMKGESIPI